MSGGGKGGAGSDEDQDHPSSAGSNGSPSLSVDPRIGSNTRPDLSHIKELVVEEPAPKQLGTDDDGKSEVTRSTLDMHFKTEGLMATSGKSFEDYCLKQELLMGIFQKGYEKPSPIQEQSLPVALAGKCVLACSQNGTGKTAAFVIPLLEKCSTAKREIQGLILVPTRELALQTSLVVKELGQHMKVQCMVLTGGTILRHDITRVYDEVHVVVATPNRLQDCANKNVCNLESCQMVVMDEADQLLCLQFRPIIENLLNFLPADRQILVYSSTLPESILDFKSKYMPEAHEIHLMDELSLRGVAQYNFFLEEKQKVHCLNKLFSKLQVNQAIIFCNSATRVEVLHKHLTAFGYSCLFIHSRMYQSQRNRVFHDFRNGACKCLVSSDLLARGIDIESVNVVINFDFPNNPETYLHRVGRSGRFGQSGMSINFVRKEDHLALYRIEQELGSDFKSMLLEGM